MGEGKTRYSSTDKPSGAITVSWWTAEVKPKKEAKAPVGRTEAGKKITRVRGVGSGQGEEW